MTKNNNFILAIDIGTSVLRCSIVDNTLQIKFSSFTKLKLVYPQWGCVEIDPEFLWNSLLSVIKNVLADGEIEIRQIAGIGISTLRASFITWKKDTGEALHNFITWKDIRSNELVKYWNQSFTINMLKIASYCLYLVTGNQRYLAGSKLKITNVLVTFRLLWALKNIPELKKSLEKNNVMFGTIETWLIYKFTKGQTYVTEISNASATGLFDPFILQWSSLSSIFGIPISILPPTIVSCDYDFGSTEESILGVSIPIKCVMSDQSSSLFASCCFNYGDVKLTMGTGSFLNVNTGTAPYGSYSDVNPLVAWKFEDGELKFMQEISFNDSGSLIEWMLSTELISDPFETSKIAEEVEVNNGVYFVPAFSGLGVPLHDPNAAAGFIGVMPTTKKGHLVRAVLESIVFQAFLIIDIMKKERAGNFKKIRVDGGVSQNNFILQSLASLTNMNIEKTTSIEMSTLGVAYLAGIKSGLWTKENLNKLPQDKIFIPNPKKQHYFKKELKNWIRAVERFKNWNH